MKKKILSLLAFSAILATSCDYNDKHFDGLDDISVPADFKGVEYTLTADDYKKIAKYPENQELVKKLDEEMEQELREKAGVDGSGKVTVLLMVGNMELNKLQEQFLLLPIVML